MKTSKKIFIACIIIFMTALLYVAYDISTKTTAPWSDKSKGDSVRSDMVNNEGNGKR